MGIYLVSFELFKLVNKNLDFCNTFGPFWQHNLERISVYRTNKPFFPSYNLRKFGELPYHLINAGRIIDLCEHVLFNYHWLHAKISAVPIDQALEDFTRAIKVISGYNSTTRGNSGHEEIVRQVILISDTSWNTRATKPIFIEYHLKNIFGL